MSQKPEKGSHLYNIRHSLAHMLAQAVLNMFPEAKLGTGPVTENGFYYDFDLPRPLIPEDLPLLEKAMRQQVKQNQLFVRRDEPIREAKAFLKKIKQPYKIELVEKFVKEQKIKQVSFYENIIEQTNKGVFVDLCEGGHVDNTKEIDPKSFQLSQISSAYWQADENNASMQRIYGISFETAEELSNYVHMMEEAKKRDHRKLGRELDLYVTSQIVGAGLPLLTPKGTIIRHELEKFSREMQGKYGYQYVTSPHIAHVDLYRTSGHYPYYAESMFAPMVVDETEQYLLKPMNCPHHQQIYASQSRSYRDLPIRYAENATIYRFERTGELNGLTRVRTITQDDSHIFCTPDQMEAEINRVIDLAEEMYKTFGLKDVAYTLSLRDPKDKEKYIGSDENWEKAESALRQALVSRKVPFTEVPGEAAFYGPKIDVKVRDVLGREWQIATIPQIDYNQPSRFGLTYIDEHGQKQTPIMLHRAVYGSFERFMGVLIEHFAGAFPTWLAPIQVEVIPVAQPHVGAAQILVDELRSNAVRVELSPPEDTLGKRIRNSELQKIPYMIVIGDKEVESNHVNVRNYHTKEQKDLSQKEFMALLKEEILERRLPVLSQSEREKLEKVAVRQKEEEKKKALADKEKKAPISPSAPRSATPESHDMYNKLIAMLDKNKAKYRLIDHEPEGRTEIVSPMRGNKVSDAAKCMILMVKIGKKETRYVLAVVPGDARVDFDAVKRLYGGSYVSFANQEIAESLAGSVAGTVLPFSFHKDLELIVDPKILKIKELYFNAARLDRSMALRTSDYEKITKPRLESIAKYA